MNQLTRLSYAFPDFSLQISLTKQALLNARFCLPEKPSYLEGGPSELSLQVIQQLDNYQQDSKFRFDLPLSFSGTAHQLKVWHLMRQIDVGQVLSYAEAAALIGSAPRAVGGACGRNPLPVFIPCHRIIAAHAGLGGFNSGKLSFGLSIKQWLLKHEGIHFKV